MLPLSDVESEQYDVAVFHDVIFALAAYLAEFFRLDVTADFEQRFPVDTFGADKALFKVAVNFACCLGGFRTFFYGPCAGFVFARSQETYKTEKFIRCFYQTVKSAFFKSEIGKENFSLVGRQLGNFFFRSRADDEGFAAGFFRVVYNFLRKRYVFAVLAHIRLRNVCGVNYGFGGQKEEIVDVFLFVFGKFHSAYGRFAFETVEYAL